jgi:hypothetical protein
MNNMQRLILLGVWSLTICACSTSEPDPMAGIKLWTSSAGGKPASFQGPEPIEIGATRVPADLYWGEGGVTLGSPGQGRPGTTIAIRPKARPSLLVVGVVRADAPDAMKKQLAGCLQSFQLR